MAKRKQNSEFFQVRRIGKQWRVCQIDKLSSTPTVLVKKVENLATQSQANCIADDYDEQYRVDLYIKEKWLATKNC
ncbi:hypothetical protein [Acinetobacter radioresistens]|uniref:hypothetical protein n=1 Tax=Acinetobacter radioresistens TaxID=40216 RepID=UPI00148E74BC|nr:hypothetical protein [Acinetobacter radioresistens]